MSPEKRIKLIERKQFLVYLINRYYFRLIEFNNLLSEGRRDEIPPGMWGDIITRIGNSYNKINQINQKLGVTQFKRPIFEWWKVKT